MLDGFALLILIVLTLTALVAAGLIAIMPGRIARERKHPQADAITVCGWMGLLTMGVLLPLAYIWAYTRSPDENAGTMK
tara:strand:+ start:36020 stop:36256 length:237 start_codon:yes stop_codon:yes gene_type:complete